MCSRYDVCLPERVEFDGIDKERDIFVPLVDFVVSTFDRRYSRPRDRDALLRKMLEPKLERRVGTIIICCRLTRCSTATIGCVTSCGGGGTRTCCCCSGGNVRLQVLADMIFAFVVVLDRAEDAPRLTRQFSPISNNVAVYSDVLVNIDIRRPTATIADAVNACCVLMMVLYVPCTGLVKHLLPRSVFLGALFRGIVGRRRQYRLCEIGIGPLDHLDAIAPSVENFRRTCSRTRVDRDHEEPQRQGKVVIRQPLNQSLFSLVRCWYFALFAYEERRKRYVREEPSCGKLVGQVGGSLIAS